MNKPTTKPARAVVRAFRYVTGPKAGTATAQWIETGLVRVGQALPSAAPLAKAVGNCGACKGDAARLDGDGGGATI